MSYSKTQLQAVFDGMILFASPIIASFKVSAFELLSKQDLTGIEEDCAEKLQKLEQSEEFKAFTALYGEAAGQLLLKIATSFNKEFNEKKEETQYGLEQYINFKANGFSVDEQLPILEHWIRTKSNHFVTHLQEHPEILSFIRNSTSFETDEILDAVVTYQISYQSFAEYCASVSNVEQRQQFFGSDQHSLSSMIGMLSFLERQKALDIYREKNFTLDSVVIKRKEHERRQKRENGAEQVLNFAKDFWREKMAERIVDHRADLREIADRNQIVRELAIFNGENSFEEIVPKKESKQKQKVSDIIGRNPKEMSALEKLKAVDTLRRLKAEQEALEEKLAKKGNKNIEQQNADRLKLAILRGESFFEKFRVVKGKELKKKQEISIIIGQDPKKMSPLQRLEAVDNLGKLIAQQEEKQKYSAEVGIKEQLKELDRTLENKPNNAKVAEKRDALAKGLALLKGQFTFISSKLAPDGSAQVRHIVEEEDNNGKKKSKLEQFQLHVEKCKKVFTHKAIKAFVDFIEAMKGLPKFNIGLDGLAQLPALGSNPRVESSSNSNPQPANVLESRKRSRSSDNLDPLAHKRPKQEQLDVLNSRKRKHSSPELLSSNPKRAKITEAASAGTLFQHKPAVAETTEQEEVAKLIPMIPTISTRA